MQRLLFASDLSAVSFEALRRAVRLAMRHGAALRIIHALSHDATDDDRESARNTLSRQARDQASQHSGPELDLCIHILRRSVEEAIVGEATSFEPDLIILGGHGDPKLRDSIFGTTVTHILRRASQPILVVKNSGAKPYSKVMLGIDEAATSRPLLTLASELAPGAQMFAVHAFEPMFRQIMDRDDVERESRTELHIMLEGLSRDMPALENPEFNPIVEKGDPMTVLERNWRQIQPDLVIMGTHARSGIAKLVLGSCADDTLLWCTADILVTRLQIQKAAEAA